MSSAAEIPDREDPPRRMRLESRLFAAFLSFFLALPLGSTLLIVRYGPSAGSGSTILGPFELPAALAAAIIGALAFRAALAVRGAMPFVFAQGAATLLLVGASIAAGVLVNRDFFTAAFQYLPCTLIAVQYRLATRPRTSLGISPAVLRGIGRAGVVVSVLYAEWLMLMGYAIVVRAEPRPIEAMLYNVYNLAQVLILFIASRWAERNAFHTVRIEGEAVEIDGRGIAGILGQKKAAIFRLLALAPERRLRCPEIQAFFREGAETAASGRCAGCTEATTKVALCAKYRNTYNSILELKRVLEFLEIGTIATPENKRRILSDGWKLALFESVRIVVRGK